MLYWILTSTVHLAVRVICCDLSFSAEMFTSEIFHFLLVYFTQPASFLFSKILDCSKTLCHFVVFLVSIYCVAFLHDCRKSCWNFSLEDVTVRCKEICLYIKMCIWSSMTGLKKKMWLSNSLLFFSIFTNSVVAGFWSYIHTYISTLK